MSCKSSGRTFLPPMKVLTGLLNSSLFGHEKSVCWTVSDGCWQYKHLGPFEHSLWYRYYLKHPYPENDWVTWKVSPNAACRPIALNREVLFVSKRHYHPDCIWSVTGLKFSLILIFWFPPKIRFSLSLFGYEYGAFLRSIDLLVESLLETAPPPLKSNGTLVLFVYGYSYSRNFQGARFMAINFVPFSS